MESPAQDTEIWHQGFPGEAVQLALSEQKLFLVWIHPETAPFSEGTAPETAEAENTSSWDSLWTNPTIKSILLQSAVCLNLTQSTANAGMFLQSVGSAANSTGLWIISSGQVVSSFQQPPTRHDLQTLLSSTLDSMKRAAQIQSQLAARRAALVAHKAQHGIPPKPKSNTSQL
jgi:hypothetical protein